MSESTDFPTRYTAENYEAYKRMMAEEYPTLAPASFRDWVLFNMAMDKSDV